MRFLTFLGVLFFGAAALAAERADMDWADLIDQSVHEFDDPYQDLTSDQLTALVDVARLQAQLDGTSAAEERTKLEARLSDAKATLAQDGIDADWLISQRWVVAERRQKAAWAGDPDVEGRIVRLGGFVIPAPADDMGRPTVYLVPERGMCSHMPPPPPNQMVQVHLTGDWRPQTIYEPVRVTGRMSVTATERDVVVVDGPVRMQAAFTMVATEVEPLAFTGAAATGSNAWVEEIAQRLRDEKGQGADEN